MVSAADPSTGVFGSGRASERRLRSGLILALVLALHGLVAYLVLTIAPPDRSTVIQPPLVVIDLPENRIPPPEPPPPPPPADPPTAKVEGGSRQPAPAAARPPERVEVTRVPLAPPPPPAPVAAIDNGTASVSLASQGAGSGTGGVGVGGDGAGDGAGSGTGTGNGKGAGTGEVLAAANWVFEPSDAELRRFNPLLPDFLKRHGATRIACQVRLDHTVHNCRVLMEKPRYWGMGKAAVRASKIFRVYPPLRDGKPVADAWVGIVIHFSN